QAAEHAVHEPARLLGRVRLGQLDGLADHGARGDVGAFEQLPRRHAQQGPVDRGHAVDGPRDGVAPDQLVEARHTAAHALDLGRRERVWRHGELGEELGRRDPFDLGLVQEAEGALPGLPPRSHTRVRYSPVRVSTLTRSPVLTNRGTEMTWPVSTVAGLRAPETRSPCTPGSVSVTVSSTAAGRSTPTISPS